jgi:phage-related protein (TIGR01555 family)
VKQTKVAKDIKAVLSEHKELAVQSIDANLKAQEAYRLADGLENLVTGMGTANDKNSHTTWVRGNKNFDFEELGTRFREDWIANKICKIIPMDTTRRWREFKDDDDHKAEEADKYFHVARKFRLAQQWANVYGTSFILLDLKRTGKKETPLDLNRLKPNCVRSMQVIDRTRVWGTGILNQEPLNPNYGFPEFYMIGGSSEKIHHSRIIRFEGTELTRYDMWHQNWYSDSILIPLMTVIDNFHTAANAAATLCQEATVDVVTVEGLQDLLTNPEGEKSVLRRFRAMKTMKSINNILLLDTTEEYTTKTVALNGVKDLIWEYLRIIAAAVGIPATRFLSASPDGMNATGESDLNNYIDLLVGFQSSQYEPRLELIDKVIQAHFGLPEWEYEWKCIFPESSLQKAEKESKIIAPIAELAREGIITRKDAQRLLVLKKLYPDFVFEEPPALSEIVANYSPPSTDNGSSNAPKK